MKYDSNTANADRWHGMSQEDIAKGYKPVDTAEKTGNRRLDGEMTESEPVEDSD
jgi:hypothetical protein